MSWRPWPRSLAGQLVLTLFAGVTLSLLSSAAIHLYDRNQAVSYMGSLQTAQRFADIVHTLDPLLFEEQKKIAVILETPHQFVHISEKKPKALQDNEDNQRAIHLKKIMQRFLGVKRYLQVEIITEPQKLPNSGFRHMMGLSPQTETNKGMIHHQGHMTMMRHMQPQSISFIARTKLAGGSWLEFHNHLPEEAFVWPWHLLWSIAILFVVVATLSILAIRLTTRPLAHLANAAKSLGQDPRRPPLTESGSLEVREVVKAFNNMQARLIQYIHERSAMLAAVSHDLKTPLTRMRLRVEMLDDEKLRDSLAKNLDEMEEMTAASMDYIQGTEGMEEVRLTDVPSLLEELQETWLEMGHSVDLQCAQIPAFPLMAKSFRRALSNLIQNAIKYGDEAKIKATLHKNRLRISVSDRGPGIPEEHMADVLRPFKRLENSRNRKTGGTGLGLSIAHNIVRAHGGELLLRNLPDGGLEVIATTPRGDISMETKVSTLK
ncbi:MAG: HAMP domain-containing protein [Magnetococcales bacterium]|nr:HAMP domain-containing protein [Magnetococcales bacterium]